MRVGNTHQRVNALTIVLTTACVLTASFVFVIATLLLSSGTIKAGQGIQDRTSIGVSHPCPPVKIKGPSEAQEGETVTLEAVVSDDEAGSDQSHSGVGFRLQKRNLDFQWSTDRGKIIEGQRTRLIKLDLKNLAGELVTTTCEVSGFRDGCVTTTSCAFQVTAKQ